jgi:hypothetical protein
MELNNINKVFSSYIFSMLNNTCFVDIFS